MEQETYAALFDRLASETTEDRWAKGSLYDPMTKCMCAHGLVQAQVNPFVKKNLKRFPNGNMRMGFCEWALDVATIGAYRINLQSKSYANEVWRRRAAYIGEDLGRVRNLSAHYLIGMVGLTAAFNDAPDTTFEMILGKFRQAAALARELGV